MVTARPKRLTDVLLQIGLVDATSLQRAVGLVQQTGKRLLNVLVETGLVEESRLVRSLGKALGVETVDLSTIQINPRVVARLPALTARTFGVLPLAAKRANEQEYLYVAMADPLDTQAAQEIRKVTGCRLSVLVAAPSQLEKMLNVHYGEAKAVVPPVSAPVVPTPPAVIGQPVTPLGIEDFRSDVVHTQLDPEISDIIITPAVERSVSASTIESAPSSDHSARVGGGMEAPLRPDREINFPAAMNQAWDDGKTLDVDIEEFHQDNLQPKSQPGHSPSSLSSVNLAMAMELPVSLSSDPSPFDGVAPVNIPAGLERTGIIPLSDFSNDEFQPPPLEETKGESLPEQVGLGDIPQSAKEVSVRYKEGAGASSKKKSSSPPRFPKAGATEPASQRKPVHHEDDVIPLPSPSPSPPERKTDLELELPSGEIELTPVPQSFGSRAEGENITSEIHPTDQPYSLNVDPGVEPTDNGEAQDLVRAMRRGESLNSAERAQIILALGRVLLDKNIITEGDLIAVLNEDGSVR